MYFPKSKIIENLYTKGKEYQISSTSKEYIGYYYQLSNGKLFVGSPNDPIQQELIKIEKPNQYKVMNNTTTTEFTLPNPFYPTPSDDDYRVGYLQRYFIKRRNADYNTIREISQGSYVNFITQPGVDTSLYVGVSLNWKITGPLQNDNSDPNFPKIGVIETNKQLVKLKEKVFPEFSKYFKDYSQFAK